MSKICLFFFLGWSATGGHAGPLPEPVNLPLLARGVLVDGLLLDLEASGELSGVLWVPCAGLCCLGFLLDIGDFESGMSSSALRFLEFLDCFSTDDWRGSVRSTGAAAACSAIFACIPSIAWPIRWYLLSTRGISVDKLRSSVKFCSGSAALFHTTQYVCCTSLNAITSPVRMSTPSGVRCDVMESISISCKFFNA